jgi:hypothetical protein
MNFSSFRAQILRDAEDNGRRWVYRGHADLSWKLETSYSRFHAKAFGDSKPFNLDHFQSMLACFIRRASELAGESYDRYSLLQKIALAQHYGVPTPLLDWSHSPYVATYFAVTDSASFHEKDVNFSVYAMDVWKLAHVGLSQAEQEDLLAGRGEHFQFVDTESFFSRRIARQSGCFTYQNFSGCLQEWKRAQPIDVDVKKYEVSGSRSQIIRELELMSITGGNLFDDLDYIAKDVIQAELVTR